MNKIILIICSVFIIITGLNFFFKEEYKVEKNNKLDFLEIPEIYINGEIPDSKEYIDGELDFYYGDKEYHTYIECRLQGNSSLDWPKKNYMIKFYSDSDRKEPLNFQFKNWTSQNKFCLKSNWIDHSQARNVVSSRLWKNIVESRKQTLPEKLKDSPTLGTIDGFPVKVYIQNKYQGMYTLNLPKSEELFNMDEDNPKQAVVIANVNSNAEVTETSANFRKLWDGKEDDDWSVEVGKYTEELKNSLNQLISCVKDTDDQAFKKYISKYLDVQSAIDYYIFQYLICGVDGLGKNLMLVTYDGTKWYVSAYDMDTTFGLHADAFSKVPANWRCPKDYQEDNSLLWERMEKIYGEEICIRYQELRNSALSYENVEKQFKEFTSTISEELYAEDTKVYNIPNASKNNVEDILEFYKNRLIYVDMEMKKINK